MAWSNQRFEPFFEAIENLADLYERAGVLAIASDVRRLTVRGNFLCKVKSSPPRKLSRWCKTAIACVTADSSCNSGFVGIGMPETLLAALERPYLESAEPRDLTLFFAAGQGDGKTRGLNRLGHEGLLARVIGGHWGLIPRVAKLATENRIEAYNLSQGVITHPDRDIAAGKPGTLSRVGLRTFVDPGLQDGRINDVTREDIVRLMEIDGAEYLFYPALKIDGAFLRGTAADPGGNITMERECLALDNLAESGSLNSRDVEVPGAVVDCVVVAPGEFHTRTFATDYNPAFFRRA